MTFLVRVSISAELLFFGVGCRPAGLSVGQGWGRHIGLRGIQGESRLVTFLPWKFVAPETLDSKLRHFARWKKTRLLWRTTNFPNFGAFELKTYSICFCSRRTYDNVKVHIYIYMCFFWEHGFLLFASSLDVSKSFTGSGFKHIMVHPWAVGG